MPSPDSQGKQQIDIDVGAASIPMERIRLLGLGQENLTIVTNLANNGALADGAPFYL
jgi:hypothetical protein